MMVTTMQAISGAGYPGVPSLDILGNVIPWISGEEPKIEQELGKLLGVFSDGAVVPASFRVSAQANRVHVRNGHMACITLQLNSKVSVDEARKIMSAWAGDPRCRSLPGAPPHPLVVQSQDDRPQPARDVDLGNGMTVSVGRIREDNIFDLRMVALGHNTVRGAAGGSVLNAELLASSGQLPLSA
jgi:aspartate-semialdehyde dehydrogenase